VIRVQVGLHWVRREPNLVQAAGFSGAGRRNHSFSDDMKTTFTHLLAALVGMAAGSPWGTGLDENERPAVATVAGYRPVAADGPGGKARPVSGKAGPDAQDLLDRGERKAAWLASFGEAGGWELRAGMMVGWDEAQALLEAVEPEQRGLAAMELAVGLLHESPQAAMAMAGFAGEAAAVGDAQRAVSVAWAQLDPRAAAEWMISGKVGSGCLAAVVGAWAGSDLHAVSVWMAGHGAAVSDEARLALIEPLREVEPDSARGWAASLADAGIRRLTLERIDAGF
jgi:hypothetical protein